MTANEEDKDHRLLHRVLSSIEPLNDPDWQAVRTVMKPVRYNKKDKILETQRVSNSYLFINTGLARLYGYKDGEEKTLFFFKEGMFAGSIESYLFQRPSQLVLEALEDVSGLEVTKEDLDAIFQASPAMSRIIMVYTQLRLNALLHYFSSFVLDSPEERYEKFIMNEPELFNRVPQHIIASFLGITPVSLSRIRKRLLDKR